MGRQPFRRKTAASKKVEFHMFEEKREAVMAIEAAVLPLMPISKALSA
jgi:hypothetical protein